VKQFASTFWAEEWAKQETRFKKVGNSTPPKIRLNFNEVQDIATQKIEFFITIAVRNSDPIKKFCQSEI
jgi:hypothetical protein